MKVNVILNPYASSSAAGAKESTVGLALAAAGLDFDLKIPRTKRQARLEAISAAASGYDAVVAAGGDGTVNEIINGLIAAAGDGPTSPVGVLPLGTGNDFSDMAGLPRDLYGAARVIAGGKTRQVDAGWVSYTVAASESNGAGARRYGDAVWQGCYFDNSSAVAMEPLVTMESDRASRLRGNLRYLVAVVRGFLQLKAWNMRITWDGGVIESPTYLLSVANTPRSGGLFLVAPNARLDDGLFDFVFAPEMPRRKALALLPSLLRGSHVRDDRFVTGRTTRLTVESRPGTPLHADGEVLCASASIVHFQVLPGKITLLAP